MTLLVDPAGRARMTPLARICLRLPDDIAFFFLAVLSFSDYQPMASLSASVLLIINETVNYTYYLKLFFFLQPVLAKFIPEMDRHHREHREHIATNDID